MAQKSIFGNLMQKFILLLVTLLLLINPSGVFSQEKLEKPPNQANQEKPKDPDADFKTHSVAKAAIYSAVLPGLGQAYNRKYWKIPIIYAGFGVIGYFVITNNKNFKDFKEAYVYTANNETYPIDNPYVGKYTLSQLQEAMDFYERNRDLSYIIGGVWYIANILEAYVDAHFFEYDISEDISMKISPSVTRMPDMANQTAPGLKISLKF
jgi:hypothetical protein